MFSALLSFLSANVLLFILHIDGSSSFPKPLSAKEERAVLERLEDGDPAARATLIERNLRLVSHIVKKILLPHQRYGGSGKHRHHWAHQGHRQF